jgi:hypothetical protein
VKRAIRNNTHKIYKILLRRYRYLRTNIRDIVKLTSAFLIGIIFILLIQFFLQGAIKDLGEPVVGSTIGIVGIGFTAVVAFLIFYMQKKADRRVNLIIESEATRRRNQKNRFCNKILDNLDQIKTILEAIKGIAQDFPNMDQTKLGDVAHFIWMRNMAIEIRLIPGIEECNKILLNHYDDLSLYDDLISLEKFRGPTSVLVQKIGEKKSLFETESDITTIISAHQGFNPKTTR